MSRRSDSTIPLLLWISAAAVVHWFSYQGTNAIAEVGMSGLDLRAFARTVHESLKPADVLEVAFEEMKEEAKPDEPKPEEPKPPPPKPQPQAKKDEPKTKDEPKKEPPKEKPPEPKKISIQLPKMTPVPPPPPPAPPPEPEKRVAVQQHVEDKNQKDAPDAKYIADEANRVKEETQARQTNHERNDKTTSPGASKSAASQEPGNADKTIVRDSEDRKGDSKRSPGESSKDSSDQVKLAGKPSPTPPPPAAPNLPPSEKAGENGRSGPKVAANNPPPAPAPATQEPPAVAPKALPDTQTAPDGTYAANPFRKPDPTPKPDSSATASRAPESRPDPKPFSIPKLGGGAGPNGINFNLTPGGALAAVGESNIKKEREADGERRRSAHRGSWKPSGLDRIRQQIENYVASVKFGTSTALNTAAKPFGTYLVRIHNKLHPIFADDFLGSLDSLPENHAMNQQSLKTVVEVVLEKEKGRIVKMGVIRTSGVTGFDVAALDAMDRAAPFGTPPSAIVSHDDRVYLHWEFHRKPEIACSTVNAFPIMLPAGAGEPATPPTLPGPRVPIDPREKGSPSPPAPSREGKLHDDSAVVADKRRAG